jgi:hypothetical protein
MKKYAIMYVILVSVLLLCNVDCGKKGPPLPPIVTIPKGVNDMTVVQTGSKIQITFTVPIQNTDSTQPAEISRIEVHRRIEMPKAEEEVIIKIIADKIKDYLIQNKIFLYDETLPEDAIKEKRKITYFVKLFSNKNRTAGPSNTITLKLGAPLKPPSDLKAVAKENAITLSWNYAMEPEKPIKNTIEDLIAVSWNYGIKPENTIGFAIYRGTTENFKALTPINSKMLETMSYEDTGAKTGEIYYYSVRAVNTTTKQESIESPALKVDYKDVIPPSTPTDLIAVVIEDHVTLHWKPVETSDLAGYKIYRKASRETEYVLLNTSILLESSYNDTNVKENIEYSYYVTAVDKSMPANESKPSNTAVIKYIKQ